MLKLGEKILLAVLQLKHSGVNEDTCAKSIQANGVFFLVQMVNGQLCAPTSPVSHSGCNRLIVFGCHADSEWFYLSMPHSRGV